MKKYRVKSTKNKQKNIFKCFIIIFLYFCQWKFDESMKSKTSKGQNKSSQKHLLNWIWVYSEPRLLKSQTEWFIGIILPRDLTFADVHASLGHEAHPSLGLLTAEGAEVMNVRRLFCDFKVSNTAIPLKTPTKQ